MDKTPEYNPEYEDDYLDINAEENIEQDFPADVPNDEELKETKRVIKPKKPVIRPQLKLDSTRLLGHRGLSVLEPTFRGIKLKGKDHEAEDLHLILTVMEHWAHRLFPKLPFESCISKIEELGSKKNVSTYVTKMRLDMEQEISKEKDSISEVELCEDLFDKLLED